MNLNDQYSRDNPFIASLKERVLLSKPGSTKETFHIVLNLEGSNISYSVGDSIAIFPKNDPILVQRVIKALNREGNEPVVNRKGMITSLADFLAGSVNLKGVSKKLLQEIALNLPQDETLKHLLNEENKLDLKEFINTHELVDVLEKYPGIDFSMQKFSDLVMPLLPRFYSIASAECTVGREAHLLITCLQYEIKGEVRHGVCTHYLAHIASINTPEVGVYLQRAEGFHLTTSKEAPLIMVGPGTGVAPFRGFIQERLFHGHPGKNWLFFGERSAATDFYYQEELTKWASSGVLKLTTAFSRDQEKKNYVQHQMLESGKELFQWLLEGGYFYVCGDAQNMAKDVDLALHKIVEEHGKLSEEEAKVFVKSLKREKRYLRDVY